MNEVAMLIRRATGGQESQREKHRAFGEIVRRFQDMAFACAFAVLGDWERAQDAAQESFLVAWRNLSQLRQPEAFAGWFKRIVLSQCNRQTRNKTLPTLSLEDAIFVPTDQLGPYALLERREEKERVALAIAGLPEHERVVVTLFYVNAYSQNDIADFLELPVTTIKKRLFSARKRLRALLDAPQPTDSKQPIPTRQPSGTPPMTTILESVQTTLQAARPSRDEAFANTVALYNEALESFLGKIKQDRQIIAVILFGSLAYDKVWEKSDIDLLLIGRDDKRPTKSFCLVENGINIHALMQPRGKFRQALERALQGSFFHSSFAKSTLLYTTDESIRDFYRDSNFMGARDREAQLLNNACGVAYTLAKAEKWFHVRQDCTYSFLWIMYALNYLAAIEVSLHDEIGTREVIQQALKHNPDFFNALYFDLIHRKKDEATIARALQQINEYMDERVYVLFAPILNYLAEEGGVRSTTELDSYFKKQMQADSLSSAYEWLADKGVIQKIPAPIRLTEKSLIEVDEAAYYYDGGALK